MDSEIGACKPRRDAVIDAAASRVRPVATGALTTIPSVVPLVGDALESDMNRRTSRLM